MPNSPARVVIGIALCWWPLHAGAAGPQTNVDRAAEALEKLASSAYDDWKASPDIKIPGQVVGDPAKADYNDSAWSSVRLGAPLQVESCWLRKTIVLPAKMLGQPVGGSLKLVIGMNGAGELWVNGE